MADEIANQGLSMPLIGSEHFCGTAVTRMANKIIILKWCRYLPVLRNIIVEHAPKFTVDLQRQEDCPTCSQSPNRAPCKADGTGGRSHMHMILKH